MVYVVAAYSITISVLLTYGVLLQHRARLAEARPGGGFNLGAALLAPIWALWHGQRAAGAGLVATAIAFLAARASGRVLEASLLAALLGAGAILLGFVGNRIAGVGSAGDAFARARGELRWALAGAVIHTIVLPWACYFWLARS